MKALSLLSTLLHALLLFALSPAAQAENERIAPPEPRVPAFHRDMPEHAMTRAIRRAEEEAFRAPITDNEGRIQYIVELEPQAASAFRAAPPPPR